MQCNQGEGAGQVCLKISGIYDNLQKKEQKRTKGGQHP